MKPTELNDLYFQTTPSSVRYNHPNPLVRSIERYRVGKIAEMVGSGGRLLELGCETGSNLERCSAEMKVGLDISKEALRHMSRDIPCVLGDAARTPFKNDAFDTVILAETLEHVHNPAAMVSEAARVLKQKGRLVVTVPYETHITVVKNLLRKLGLMRLLFRGIPERTTEFHVQFFTPESLKRLLSVKFGVEKLWVGPFPVLGPIIFARANKTP